ncbi:MAG: purine-binding chemotaxis protein CheW, partial [Planctomycetes bacterium]|nr:purine-binding chemotaxis protein CheW [Planctomycetota bacterium]
MSQDNKDSGSVVDTSLENSSLAGKYLTFYLDDEEYGVDVLQVKEIISIVPITKVPQTPPFVMGVINLRGEILPVINLRRFLKIPKTEQTPSTRVIVSEDGDLRAGLIIDSITRVFSLRDTDIETV